MIGGITAMMVFMMVLMTGIAQGGMIVQGGAATAGMGTIKVNPRKSNEIVDFMPPASCGRGLFFILH